MAEPPILLLTRPHAQAHRFAEALTGCLADLPRVIAPLQAIEPRPLMLDPAPYATLIFTSENGVAGFAAQSGLRDRTAWCVGPRTAQAAAAAGFDVRSATAAGGNAEALIAGLRAARPATPMLHLRGAHAVTPLARRLTAEGLACDEAVVYAQMDLPPGVEVLSVLSGAQPVLLPLFSPRSARLAARAARLAGDGPPVHVVAISDAAADRWRALRPDPSAHVTVAPRPDAAGMLEGLRTACRRLSA